MGKIYDIIEKFQEEMKDDATDFERYIVDKKISLAVRRIIKNDLGYSVGVDVQGQCILGVYVNHFEYIIYDDGCNATDYVDFWFDHIKKLQDKIELLEMALKSFEGKRRAI